MADELDRRRDAEKDWERRQENLRSMAERELRDLRARNDHELAEARESASSFDAREPLDPLDPVARQRQLSAEILQELPRDQLVLDWIEPEIRQHMQATLAGFALGEHDRAFSLVSWAIAGLQRTLDRRDLSSPAWLRAKLRHLQAQQSELQELGREVLRLRMQPPEDA